MPHSGSRLTADDGVDAGMQSLLRALPMSAALLDASGTVLIANDLWSGCSAEGVPRFPCVPPGASWADAAEEAIASGAGGVRHLISSARRLMARDAEPFEAVCACPRDGALRPVAVRVARLNQDSDMVRLLVTVTEVRELEGAEARRLQGLRRELADLHEHRDRPDGETTPWASVAHTLESMSDAFCAVDHDWRIVWFNRRGRELALQMGMPENTGAETLFDTIPWLMDSPLRHAAERAKAEQRPLEVVQTFFPTERQFRVRIVPTGNGLGMFARELRDEETIEAAHAAYAERSRELFDTVPVPLFVFHRDSGRILAVNQAAANKAGWDAHALTAMSVRDLVPTEEWSRLAKAMAGPGGVVQPRGHWPVIRRNGDRFIADVVTSDLPFDGLEARIAMFRDVTMELELAAELRLLREGVARLNDVLVITEAEPCDDGSLRITFVNEAFERRTGWTRDETIGQSTSMLDGSGTSSETLARIRSAIARREPVREELLQYTRDGRDYWIELEATPMLDGEGVLTHWMAVQRDITDRRRLEEQLFQAQKMDAVGRLAGGVAHDFNNVLTAISGFSELLLEELPEGSGPHEEVLQIRAASDRAAALTRQLLAFSRKQILRPRRVDLNAMTSEMEPFIRRVISAEVAIRTMLEPGEAPVHADPVQLEQVLLNLVVNASEAMPNGGMLTIETGMTVLGEAYAARHHGVVPGRYACLAVSDSGVGMDRQTRERAFEPFFTTKSGGTGLGLSTVYGIVQQSGGHVWVYSEPGVGTTFKVYLPVAGADSEAPQPAAIPTAVLGGTETILVVEDEAMVRDVSKAMLTRRGYHVLVASDGEQALRVARQHPGPIHLLLTDVVMPRANGRRVAEQLSMARPGLRVLFMSGYTEDAIVHHGVLEQGITLIEKPFTDMALARRVRELLDAPAQS